jgi:hypothetical protein
VNLVTVIGLRVGGLVGSVTGAAAASPCRGRVDPWRQAASSRSKNER